MTQIKNNFIESIGNTPLIKLKAASEITGCHVYGKAEYLNPGGSVKDRAALALIKEKKKKKLISEAAFNLIKGVFPIDSRKLFLICVIVFIFISNRIRLKSFCGISNSCGWNSNHDGFLRNIFCNHCISTYQRIFSNYNWS